MPAGRPPRHSDLPGEALLLLLSMHEIEIEDLAHLALLAVFELCKGTDLSVPHIHQSWTSVVERLASLGAEDGHRRHIEACKQLSAAKAGLAKETA